jgi:hypothetical protein
MCFHIIGVAFVLVMMVLFQETIGCFDMVSRGSLAADALSIGKAALVSPPQLPLLIGRSKKE